MQCEESGVLRTGKKSYHHFQHWWQNLLTNLFEGPKFLLSLEVYSNILLSEMGFLNSTYSKHCSYEERARCIREISRNCARPTTFEDFCSKIFAPNLPPSGHTHKDDDNGLHRTFSAPSSSRSNSLKDSAGVLRFMEMHETQTFRSRTQSALPKNSKHSEHKQVCK